MSEPWADRSRQALLALADLSPSAEQSAGGLVVPTDWFRWLSARSVELFARPPDRRGVAPDPLGGRADVSADLDRHFAERLEAVDQVRGGGRSLRVGWLWVAGRAPERDGKRRRVLHPLLTVPVRVERVFGSRLATLRATGDVMITPLVEDEQDRRRLERNIVTGGGALVAITQPAIPGDLLPRLTSLASFARSVAHAADFPVGRLVPATEGPDELLRRDDLVIVAGVAVFSRAEVGTSSRAASLRLWAEQDLRRWTSFHAVYADTDPPARPSEPADIESPFPLTPTQRAAVRAAAHQPVTVLSGPPGTGKSHTIAAIALDALARGEDVLVAAKSDATVDALLDLLERAPGPDPVVFGSNERRDALAARLAGGLSAASDDAVVAARGARDRAIESRDAAAQAIRRDLEAEALLGTAGAGTTPHPFAPGFFTPDADLAAADALLAASRRRGSWWANRSARRAERALRREASASDEIGIDDLGRALDEAHALRASRAMAATGGLDIADRWDTLRSLDDAAQAATARWLAAETRSSDRIGRAALGAIAAVATALRSGRSARRELLSRIDDDRLTKALPLWLGTLADIDDLLPAALGLFDVVVLDEASSIDQPLAAPALLRGKRAVVVGDPRQLRHVSFLSDDQQQDVMRRHGFDRAPVAAARLDVRRNSAFDVAASVAPVITLDEHFRSDPHLVDFIARRVYAGHLQLATRTPRTTGRDCVDVVRVDGDRDEHGIVAAEVRWVVRRLQAHARDGARSVGVVTPFRAQADAIEEAVLEALPLASIQALDLRVGTVHAFQGNERDVVLAPIGIGPSAPAGSWRFVDDAPLFTVMMTRARRHLTLVLSADPPPGGLLADYIRQQDHPPGPPHASGPVSPWAEALADDLEAAGVRVTRAYPTGRHAVDLCIGEGWDAVAVVCAVHPQGSAAHIRRHLALVRAGWTVVEALPSRWEERRGELVVELLRRVQGR